MTTQVCMLILAACLASVIASPSTARDPKELLLLPHSYSPFYRVPSMQSRYGLTQRQTNSPMNPMIAQQGLGPFFGYFPNLLTQPCPACAECEICPACDACPVVPTEPLAASIQVTVNEECKYGKLPVLASAPSGTISLNAPATGGSDRLYCRFGLMAYYPNTKVHVKCTTLGDGTAMGVLGITPDASSFAEGVAGTVYVSTDDMIYLEVTNKEASNPAVAECSWEILAA